ncbi:MAG TPA: molybdopterin cofactor-binding domain-containing protein [Thermoanaerobaculia bacterium]|nr:molybdopterin cofactor-binding domain-containing protein [Thermoanaerobaculia bacterium]
MSALARLLSPGSAAEGMSRRVFLVSTAIAGGGFLLGAASRSSAATLVGAAAASPQPGEIPLTPWVRITPDNAVTIVVSQSEIGQGISTTLPAILAGELGADWDAVRLETAPYALAYRNPERQWMFTGNSESCQAFYDLMRQMGAAAREMLTGAAASRWGVSPDACRTEKGFVVHEASGKRVSFGEIAAEAAKLPVPAKPRLRAGGEPALVGKPVPRVDIPAKVDGTARFGIDMQVPGMLLAAIRTAPTLAGKLRSMNREAVAGMPGVRAVVALDNGAAVVADTYWQARMALKKLPLEFEPGPNLDLSSSSLIAEYRKALENGPWATPVNEGDVSAGLGRAAKKVTADYESPFLAHATMEPMNCTASVTSDRCEIWAPTQGQELAFFALKQALGLKDDQIQVNRSPYAGGGFGRRLLPDFVVMAALISKAAGKPVKVIWDREEDIRRDWYRPATATRLAAGLDADGNPTALSIRVVSPTILHPVFPSIGEFLQQKGFDPSAMEGMLELIYDFPVRRVDFHLFKTSVPTSVMRTTGYGPNTFALESFVDELAHAARSDPYRYRRRLLAKNPRALRLLDRVATLSGWEKPVAKGHGRGIAVADAFGSYIAQVIEVAASGPEVRVLRVTSVVDCGRVLDPVIAKSNIECGVIFGLSYCKSEIAFDKGGVVQGNFDGYELPYLAESPELVTEFLPSGEKLGGIGETGPVPVPPALANAVFAATGKRLRAMPLGRNGLRLGFARPPKGRGYA